MILLVLVDLRITKMFFSQSSCCSLVLYLFYFQQIVLRPIVFLAKKTKDIQRLRFDDVIRLKTHIYEVQLLVNALNALKSIIFFKIRSKKFSRAAYSNG